MPRPTERTIPFEMNAFLTGFDEISFKGEGRHSICSLKRQTSWFESKRWVGEYVWFGLVRFGWSLRLCYRVTKEWMRSLCDKGHKPVFNLVSDSLSFAISKVFALTAIATMIYYLSKWFRKRMQPPYGWQMRRR